jgi:hypothetical protein
MAANSGGTVNNVFASALALFGGGGVADQLVGLTRQLEQLQTVSQAAVESTNNNTRAVQGSSSSQASGGSVATTVLHTVEQVFGSGLGIVPLISGLAGLFGGGGNENTAPPITKFALPPPVNLSAGVSDIAPGQVFGVDYGQGNQPRPVSSPAPTQITVQVQAMDSASFLDHSNDIALAVRQAMLESSVLNDVIREV